MRELAFAGLTDDGGLLLTSGDGQKYALAVDERLVAAVRGDRPRLGQLSIAMEGATPRDIQTRVRHGQSPQDVAEQTGLDLEHVERYAGPPLAERAHVAGLARTTEVRRLDGSTELLELVSAALSEGGVAESSVSWDAWRREDGAWTVLVEWDGGDLGAHQASWSYDPAGRTVQPDDQAARTLQGERPSPALDDEQVRRHLVGLHAVIEDESDIDLGVAPRAPWGEDLGSGSEADSHHTAVVDRYSGDVVLDLAAGPPAQPTDVPLADLFDSAPDKPKPTRRSRRKSVREPEATDTPTPPARGKSRAAVPSWDEILFGSKRTDD